MDEAGRLAAERAIDMARSLDFQVKIISLPEGYKDIADFALEHPEKLKEIIKEAEDAGEYYYRKALTQFNLEELSEKRKAIEFLLSKIAWIENPVERAEWLKRIAEGFDIREEFLQESLEKIKNDLNKKSIAPVAEERNIIADNMAKTRHELLSERAVALALKLQVERRVLEEISNFLVEEHQKLVRFILDSSESKLNNESVWESLGYLNLLADYEFADEEMDWHLEFEKISLELKKEFLRRNIELTTYKLKEAEAKNNEEEISRYLEELNKLLKEFSY
jgi:DNA primase